MRRRTDGGLEGSGEGEKEYITEEAKEVNDEASMHAKVLVCYPFLETSPVRVQGDYSLMQIYLPRPTQVIHHQSKSPSCPSISSIPTTCSTPSGHSGISPNLFANGCCSIPQIGFLSYLPNNPTLHSWNERADSGRMLVLAMREVVNSSRIEEGSTTSSRVVAWVSRRACGVGAGR